MLYIIGLGLRNETDITVKGLEAVKRCNKVYIEAYTSLLRWSHHSVGLLSQAEAYTEDATCVGFEQLGSEDQMVVAGSMKQLLMVDFGETLHCFVLVVKLIPWKKKCSGFIHLGGKLE